MRNRTRSSSFDRRSLSHQFQTIIDIASSPGSRKKKRITPILDFQCGDDINQDELKREEYGELIIKEEINNSDPRIVCRFFRIFGGGEDEENEEGLRKLVELDNLEREEYWELIMEEQNLYLLEELEYDLKEDIPIVVCKFFRKVL